MNNKSEQSLFELYCKVESISSLVRNILANLEDCCPSDASPMFREHYGDAYNLAFLASQQIADADQMMLALMDTISDTDFPPMVQVDVTTAVTVSANAEFTSKSSRKREVSVCAR